MVTKYGYMMLGGLLWATLLTGCEHEHESDFANHVPSTTSNVTRYRGRYQTAADGQTLVDTICVVDYVRARQSETGDSIRAFYLRLEPGQPELRTVVIADIGYLNQQIALRHTDNAEAYAQPQANGEWVPMRVSDLEGTVETERLRFAVSLNNYHVTFDGQNATHSEGN